MGTLETVQLDRMLFPFSPCYTQYIYMYFTCTCMHHVCLVLLCVIALPWCQWSSMWPGEMWPSVVSIKVSSCIYSWVLYCHKILHTCTCKQLHVLLYMYVMSEVIVMTLCEFVWEETFYKNWPTSNSSWLDLKHFICCVFMIPWYTQKHTQLTHVHVYSMGCCLYLNRRHL